MATHSRSLLRLMSTESVMPSNHLILCGPLLLLPSIFPSNEGLFQMRESIARQVDKSGVPKEEKGAWGSQEGDRGL